MMAVDDGRRQLDRIALKNQGKNINLPPGYQTVFSSLVLGSSTVQVRLTEISRPDDIPANYQRNWHPHRPRHPPHQDWINC